MNAMGRPPRIFVSAPDVREPPAADLVRALRAAGAEVEQSPAGGDDPRFGDWYDTGLLAAVRRCDALVIVPITWWDGSTWMATEADAGLKRALSDQEFDFCAWSPGGIQPPQREYGMYVHYVGRAAALPPDPHEAAEVLVNRVRRRSPS